LDALQQWKPIWHKDQYGPALFALWEMYLGNQITMFLKDQHSQEEYNDMVSGSFVFH
jgi:hypothetical protein